MKSDSVEGGKVASAVQLQALAHPEVAFTFIRDGKQTLQTPGSGDLGAAVYCVYGRDSAKFIELDSKWEGYRVRGFVSKPTDARPSRSLQTFFVNDRPVKSRLLIQALEEAYRNQIMVGKFPACVLHLTLPANAVDVNVHPAKTEVKFLSEKAVFDCVHYGVLSALNKTPDRPNVQFKAQPTAQMPVQPAKPTAQPAKPAAPKQENFFRTMSAEEFRTFSQKLPDPPKPQPKAAAETLAAVRAERPAPAPIRNIPMYPKPEPQKVDLPKQPLSVGRGLAPAAAQEEPVQEEIATMPREIPWRIVGELYRSYVIVEQGDNAFLIDKHAAHERILFEKLRENPTEIVSQQLLAPAAVRLRADGCAILLASGELLNELGFEIEEFGENTILVRRVPMDLGEGEIADTLMQMADDLLSGRGEDRNTVRDELLHTMACKAAIKAGWKTDGKELEVLVKQVMSREDLKYCPHGRPICITLSKKQLEKQFKRS